MAHAIRMPKPGQMTEECVLTLWRKAEGEVVQRGDVLFEIETDKAAMEVESFEAGVLLRQVVAEGQTVPVNAICAYVGAPGEAIPETAPEPWVATGSAEPAPKTPTSTVVAPSTPAVPAGPRPASASGRLRISPRASRLAAEAGLDLRAIVGSGPGGRILERDIEAAVAAIALTDADTDEAAAEAEPRPLSRMRRLIAQRLTQSFTSVPHFTITVAVDVTSLEAFRQELKAGGTSLTVTDVIMDATAQSLVELPDVNARTDGLSVWPRRRVHLGLAVALPAGLVVVVVRDADRLSLGEIHERVATLAEAARTGQLGPDDMTGSTFTVSNLGMFGVDEFSAIINPGESGILAVGRVIPTAVVVPEGIAVRSMMKLTLSADHRQVDGVLGARFLDAVRRRLENPAL